DSLAEHRVGQAPGVGDGDTDVTDDAGYLGKVNRSGNHPAGDGLLDPGAGDVSGSAPGDDGVKRTVLSRAQVSVTGQQGQVPHAPLGVQDASAFGESGVDVDGDDVPMGADEFGQQRTSQA